MLTKDEARARFLAFCSAAGADESYPNEEDYHDNVSRLNALLETIIFPLLPDMATYLRCAVDEALDEATNPVIDPTYHERVPAGYEVVGFEVLSGNQTVTRFTRDQPDPESFKESPYKLLPGETYRVVVAKKWGTV